MIAGANRELFWSTGLAYYVAARSAFLAQQVPVSGNLFHHATENLLKGLLSQKRSLRDLKLLGHDLRLLWRDFKAEFPGTDLTQFDKVVKEVHRFEELRYPTSKGMEVHAEWQRPQRTPTLTLPKTPPGIEREFRPPRAVPKYYLYIDDIDHLVVKIFELSSRNPKAYNLSFNEYARDAIARNNPVAGDLL